MECRVFHAKAVCHGVLQGTCCWHLFVVKCRLILNYILSLRLCRSESRLAHCEVVSHEAQRYLYRARKHDRRAGLLPFRFGGLDLLSVSRQLEKRTICR